MEKNRKYYTLFVIGQIITFLFIILLQIMNRNLFLILLVLMHVGIVFIILSKKGFIKSGYNIKSFYKRLYLLLTPFLPMVFYKLLSYLFSYSVNESFVLIYTLLIAAITIILSTINTISFYRYLTKTKK